MRLSRVMPAGSGSLVAMAPLGVVGAQRALVEGRRIVAREAEEAPVGDHVTANAPDALCAKLPQQQPETFPREAGVAAASDEQIATQYSVADVGTAGHAGVPVKSRPKPLEGCVGCDQFHD